MARKVNTQLTREEEVARKASITTLKAFYPTAVERLYFSNIIKEFSHYS